MLCRHGFSGGELQQSVPQSAHAMQLAALHCKVSHVLAPGTLKPNVDTRLGLSPHTHLNCFKLLCTHTLDHGKLPNTACCPGPCCSDERRACASSSQALLRSLRSRSCPAAAPTASPAAARRTAWRPAGTHSSWLRVPRNPGRRCCAKSLDMHSHMHPLAVIFKLPTLP